jgi:16S rRNA processing protein RimM
VSGDDTLVVLGRVTGAHGLRGQLRVRILGDDAGNLGRVREVWLARHREDLQPARHAVRGVAAGRRGEVRLALSGVKGRDAAQALRGRLVLAEARRLAALPAGQHYWYELVGCEVLGEDGRSLGRVRELWDPGPHDVLVVERPNGGDLLVPAADAWLLDVDVATRRVVVRLLPFAEDPAARG